MTSVHATSHPTAPAAGALLHGLAENWWLVLLRGIAGVIFGALAFAWPGLTLLTLIFLWGAYAFVDGAFALWGAISGKGGTMAPRWWLAIVGIAGLAAGALAFAMPGITALVLLLFIAAWAIVTGMLEIIGAIRLRKEIDGEWLMILGGALSVLFGIILFVQPGTGALALVWLIGATAIVVGILHVALAFRLRKHKG